MYYHLLAVFPNIFDLVLIQSKKTGYCKRLYFYGKEKKHFLKCPELLGKTLHVIYWVVVVCFWANCLKDTQGNNESGYNWYYPIFSLLNVSLWLHNQKRKTRKYFFRYLIANLGVYTPLRKCYRVAVIVNSATKVWCKSSFICKYELNIDLLSYYPYQHGYQSFFFE